MKNSTQKISETIQSIVYYLDQDDKEQKTSVLIEINYSSKSFNIKTNNNNDHFKFINNSHQSNLCIATCDAIKNGIVEAKALLNEKILNS